MLDAVKTRLQITHNDDDAMLMQLIEAASVYFSVLVGIDVAFETETDKVQKYAKQLAIEYIRYGYNNAADEFETNYEADLTRLITMAAVQKRKGVTGE